MIIFLTAIRTIQIWGLGHGMQLWDTWNMEMALELGGGQRLQEF